MLRSATIALCLLLSSTAFASNLLRQAAFLRLHRDQGPTEVRYEPFTINNFQIVGERILLENGKLTVTIQKVTSGELQAASVGAQAVMPLNDGFFADPYTTGVNNFLTASTLTVGTLSGRTTVFDEATNETEQINIDLKNVRIVHSQKSMSGSMKALIFTAEFQGRSAYSKADKKLTATLESVKVGGIPVPMDLVFFFLKSVVTYDFVALQKPNIIINLGPFFPVP